jgi:hypothetical protein
MHIDERDRVIDALDKPGLEVIAGSGVIRP